MLPRDEEAMRIEPAKLWSMIRRAVSAMVEDGASTMGAALSYYTLFSLAPVLVIVIAVAGFVFDQAAVQQQILEQLGGLVGPEGARAIEELLSRAQDRKTSGWAAAIGSLALLIGATTVFAELQSALDRIWRVPARATSRGIWGVLELVRARLLSFGSILGVGFLLAVSLAVSTGITALSAWWGSIFEGWQLGLMALNFLLGLIVITALFAMIYKILPRVAIGWRDVWIGAAVTALLFNVGQNLIGIYLGASGIVSAFGAAGSIAVLLVWVYYSAQIFLLGAEFTWVYAHEHGSRAGRTERTNGSVQRLRRAPALLESGSAPAVAGMRESLRSR